MKLKNIALGTLILSSLFSLSVNANELMDVSVELKTMDLGAMGNKGDRELMAFLGTSGPRMQHQIVKIVSNTDLLELNKVTVNRGNCTGYDLLAEINARLKTEKGMTLDESIKLHENLLRDYDNPNIKEWKVAKEITDKKKLQDQKIETANGLKRLQELKEKIKIAQEKKSESFKNLKFGEEFSFSSKCENAAKIREVIVTLNGGAEYPFKIY